MSQPQLVRNLSHVVQFYQSAGYLSEAVGRFLADGFRNGNPMIIIAIPEHITLFRGDLHLQGYDLELAVRSGQLAEIDARTLARFMDDSLPNSNHFFQIIRAIVRSSTAGRENRTALVYCELLDVLRQEEKCEGAIALEQFWNDLSSAYALRLLCSCPMERFHKEADRSRFDAICRAHTVAVPTERYTRLGVHERLCEIARLQQCSRVLDDAVLDLTDARNARSFLTALVDSDEFAIIGKTLDGVITSWNRGAERIFGYTASEVIGKPNSMLMPSDSPLEEAGILECIRGGGRVEHYQTRRFRKDGSIIDISLTVSPVRNPKGEIIGTSKVVRDITENKRMEAEIQAANRIKDEFLAVLSHELRTPLHVILGWTDILKSARNADELRSAARAIHRNAEMLNRLIDDLLDLSRILTGKMIIKSERVDLPAVAKAAIASVRVAAVAKAITVELNADKQVQVVIGDPDRLQQVIWNLLANAIKFTPTNGKVELQLRNNGSVVEIAVSDTGEGISAEFLPHLFERFRQADAGSTRQRGGIGVGLALVRHLVEAHGGTVRASSNGRGQGATFVVRLPVVMEGRMKTGSDVVLTGFYATECCLAETELDKRQTFPRCPECLGLTVWVPVNFIPASEGQKAA